LPDWRELPRWQLLQLLQRSRRGISDLVDLVVAISACLGVSRLVLVTI
jgi:hypothetical protein